MKETTTKTPLTERAKALYAPPFRYEMGYIHDSKHKMVADDVLPEPEHLEPGMALRVRGWGHIQKHEDPEALQDEVGKLMAEALTGFWERNTLVEALECAEDADAIRQVIVLGDEFHAICDKWRERAEELLADRYPMEERFPGWVGSAMRELSQELRRLALAKAKG